MRIEAHRGLAVDPEGLVHRLALGRIAADEHVDGSQLGALNGAQHAADEEAGHDVVRRPKRRLEE